MGIGTLILFIAFILVAGVAASVIISTSGSLQEQALSTGQETESEISTHAHVVEISGTDGFDGYVDDLSTIFKLSAGSDPMKIDEIMLSEMTTNSSSTLIRKRNAQCINDVFTGYFTARGSAAVTSTTAFEDPVGTTSVFGPTQTSLMMIGKIAVAIVFVESNGSVDGNLENWTTEEQDNLIEHVTTALNWWSAIEPRAHIRFTYEIYRGVPTSYEPITRTTAEANQDLWINEVLDGMGVPPGASKFSRARSFDNELRLRMNAHWAYTIFFVDSSEDADGAFPDGFAGIAYINGPYAFIAGDAWPNNMPALIAHETGHIFGARDEYTASGCTCEDTGGYYGIETQNCQLAAGQCVLNQSSIMRGSSVAPLAYFNREVDVFAKAQMGLIDTNENDIMDPVDELFVHPTGVNVTDTKVKEIALDVPAYDPESINKVGFFAYEYLAEGSNFVSGNLQRGDILKVCQELSRPIDGDELLHLSLIPKSGTPTLTEFYTPDVIAVERVYFYP